MTLCRRLPGKGNVMSQADPNVSANPSRRRWLTRRNVILGTAVLIAVGLAVFGRGILARWARQTASRRLSVGAVSAAEQWLARSAWFDPSDGRTDLIRAICLRQRYEEQLWNEALDSAERHGAPAELIQRERQLGRIQAGTISETENELIALVEAGASPDDVCAAFVHGYLASKDVPRAEMVLEAWAKEHPSSAQLAYVRGIYWEWLADAAGDLMRQRNCFDRAEEAYNDALAKEPRHEPARKSLAELLEDQDRVEEARTVYAAMAAQAPTSESAKLGLGRQLRGLGLRGQARAALQSLGPRLEASPAAAAEMGQVELESGNYEEAQRWFSLANPETTADADTLRGAAAAFAIPGDTTAAKRLLARLDYEYGLWARTRELLTRLATGAHDPKAADELRRLSSSGAGLPATEPIVEDRSRAPPSDRYLQQCSGCHGTSGEGNGRAVRHLFPRARGFRAEKFRLAGTLNGIPTLDDVASVIRQGMPGTSMRAYDDLSDEQQAELAREVLRQHREGVREQLVSTLRAEEEEIDEEEVGQIVDFCTTAGEVVHVPPIDPADSGSIARGKEAYFKLGCDNCHGEDGTGAWDTPLFDDKGRPSPPRDLVAEPFKGGHEPESIYLRIFVGMPGTPHPAASNVAEDQLVELVHFCRSLSREPKRVLTNHQRAVEASRRHTLWAFESPPEP